MITKKYKLIASPDKNNINIQNGDLVLWANEILKIWGKQEYGELEISDYVIPTWSKSIETIDSWHSELLGLYDHFLHILSPILDCYHNTSYGVKGWNYLLGYWLFTFIQSIHDKVNQVMWIKDNGISIDYNYDNDYFIVEDRDDYSFFSIRDYQQMADVLDYFDGVERENNLLPYITKRNQLTEGSEIEDKETHIFNKKHRNKSLLVDDRYLNAHMLVLYFVSLGRINKYDCINSHVINENIDVETRKKYLCNIEEYKDYGHIEFLVASTLWKNLPICLFEGFKLYSRKWNKSHFVIPHKFMSTANVYGELETSLLAAETVSRGGKVYLVQHGGNYGLLKYVNESEWRRADKFFTWGWKGDLSEFFDTIQPIAFSKTLINNNRREYTGEKRPLLMCYSSVCSFSACLDTIETLDYSTIYMLENDFLKLIHSSKIKKIDIRPYIHDYEINRTKKIEAICEKSDKCFLKTGDYYKSILSASIVITCLISTTYIETIYYDIPTMVIVPEEKYVFTQEAQSVVEDLQKLDVFVKTPKDAIRVIEKIYGRETEWWNEPSRKKTINEFKKLYCKKDLLGIKWHAVLLKEAFTR